jgi:hypothetical protein
MPDHEEDSRLKRMLSYDAFGAAEDLTGKKISEDTSIDLLALTLIAENQKERSNLLTKRGDTTFSMGMQVYLEILEQEGFERVWEGRLNRGYQIDKIVCLWHPKDTLLAKVDSFGSDRNGATIYMNYVFGPNGKSRLGLGDSRPYRGDNVSRILTSIDAREGVRYKLNCIRDLGGFFLNPWDTPVGTLNFNQDYSMGETWEQKKFYAQRKHKKRLEMLPLAVQKSVNFYT